MGLIGVDRPARGPFNGSAPVKCGIRFRVSWKPLSRWRDWGVFVCLWTTQGCFSFIG